MTAELIARIIIGLLMFVSLVLWLHFYSKFATKQIRCDRKLKAKCKEVNSDGIEKDKA